MSALLVLLDEGGAAAGRSSCVTPAVVTARRSGSANLRRLLRLRVVANYGGESASAVETVALDSYLGSRLRAATVKPIALGSARRSGIAERRALKTVRRSAKVEPKAEKSARRSGMAPLSWGDTLRLRVVALYGGESASTAITLYPLGASASVRRGAKAQPNATTAGRRSGKTTPEADASARRSARTVPGTPIRAALRAARAEAQATKVSRRSATTQPQGLQAALRSATASSKATGTRKRSATAQAQAEGLQKRSATSEPKYSLTTGADRRASDVTPAAVTNRRSATADASQVTSRRAADAIPQQTLVAKRAGTIEPQAADTARRSGDADGKAASWRRRAGAADASPPPPTGSGDRRAGSAGQPRQVNWAAPTPLVAYPEATAIHEDPPTQITENVMQKFGRVPIPARTNYTHAFEFFKADGSPWDVSGYSATLIWSTSAGEVGRVPLTGGLATNQRVMEFTVAQTTPPAGKSSVAYAARIEIDKGGAAGPEDAASGTLAIG